MDGHDHQIVFLSASIPDPERWDAPFDPFEITDAVVALATAILTAGWTLVTAAHPTIAPLILHVGGGIQSLEEGIGRVRLYQSDLFADQIPAATASLADQSFVSIIWTQRAQGEEPRPGRWNRSLLTMREQMFEENEIEAGIFVGGMDGIEAEWEMIGRIRPEAARVPLWGPGGASSNLDPPAELAQELTTSLLYPYLADLVVDYLRQRGGQ